jgi:hypothetical protein
MKSTIDADRLNQLRPNPLEAFPTALTKFWVVDITYVPLKREFVYLVSAASTVSRIRKS